MPHCALESCVHPEGQREPLSPRGSKEGDTQSRVQGDCPSRWSPVSLALGRGRQLREGRCLCPSPPGLDLELWVTVSGAGVGWGGPTCRRRLCLVPSSFPQTQQGRGHTLKSQRRGDLSKPRTWMLRLLGRLRPGPPSSSCPTGM